MLFNSLNFILFLPVVLGLYALLRNHWQGSKILLLAASYVFYMAWNPPFVLLLIFSTALDYVAGRSIAAATEQSRKRIWLFLSCLGNLGVLSFFKYGQFFSENIDAILGTQYAQASMFDNWILPVGISFYTFQSLSYTIDVYRDSEKATLNLLDFALFVSFFPQLVAGPIVRSTTFLPQLKARTRLTAADTLIGLDLIFRGFAKKVLIADNLAPYVDTVFANPEAYGAANQLLALYAYAFQIYCDFSGYSDIAIGLARILGFKIPINFNLPYLSTGPTDFWTRWHISFSTWFRDYLYIPLGGSQGGRWRLYRNFCLTMGLGGLWHGAGWGFILWGLYNGVWLVLHRVLVLERKLIRVHRFVAIFVTFHIYTFSLSFFRGQTLSTALVVIRQLVDFTKPFYLVPMEIPLLVGIGFITHILGASETLKAYWERAHFAVRGAFYAGVILLIILSASDTQQFIYFQF